MIRLSLTKTITIILGSISLVILVITIFIGVPAIREIMRLRDDVETTQSSLSSDYAKTQRLRKSLKDVKSVFEQVQPFTNSTIEHGKELDIITQLENIATANQVKQDLEVSFIDPRQAGVTAPSGDTAPNEPHYRILFTSEGSTLRLLQYIQALEQLPYYITIDRLEWSKTKNAKDPNANTVNVHFAGYILLSDPEAAPAVSAGPIHTSTASL